MLLFSYNFHYHNVSNTAGPQGRDAAMRGMFHWMKYTCLQFVPREGDDDDYVEFVEHDGLVPT